MKIKRAGLFFLFFILMLQLVPAQVYSSLDSVAKERKGKINYDPLTEQGNIIFGHDMLRFKLDFPFYYLGEDEIFCSESIRMKDNKLEISENAISKIDLWLAERKTSRESHFTVAAILIDPGHGGKDPGAIGEFGSGKNKLKIQEKDVVLDISKDLLTKLKQKWPDKNIMITRSTDTYPSLDDRVNMANQVELGVNEAIIYVSVHANASFRKDASGYEVWYLNPEYRRSVIDDKKTEGVDKNIIPILNSMLEEEYTSESIFLAQSILSGMEEQIGEKSNSRGIRAEEWFVVRNAKMPSVLIEVGFVTNENEAKLLDSKDYLHNISSGIYNGIENFVNYFEKQKGTD